LGGGILSEYYRYRGRLAHGSPNKSQADEVATFFTHQFLTVNELVVIGKFWYRVLEWHSLGRDAYSVILFPCPAPPVIPHVVANQITKSYESEMK
jgi:hypothetical protein